MIPVLSIRMPTQVKAEPADIKITLKKIPEQIANRIVTFGLAAEQSLFSDEDIVVRPVLLSNGQHVGHAGMVLDADYESKTQIVRMKPGTSCTVGVQLLRDDVESVEIVILDPETDRILKKSAKIPVNLGL